MKRVPYLLTIFLLLFSCNFSKREPSVKQKEFAKKLLQTPGILKVDWYTTSILDVTVDLDRMGMHPKLKAKELADQIGSAGYRYTGEALCVNIFYPNLNKLASSCTF